MQCSDHWWCCLWACKALLQVSDWMFHYLHIYIYMYMQWNVTVECVLCLCVSHTHYVLSEWVSEYTKISKYTLQMSIRRSNYVRLHGATCNSIRVCVVWYVTYTHVYTQWVSERLGLQVFRYICLCVEVKYVRLHGATCNRISVCVLCVPKLHIVHNMIIRKCVLWYVAYSTRNCTVPCVCAGHGT